MASVVLDGQRGSGYCHSWACEHTEREEFLTAPVVLDDSVVRGIVLLGHVNTRCLFRIGRAVWSLQPRGCSPIL